MKHDCRYVLRPFSFELGSAEYCEKPVSFFMDTDDDGNKVRRWNPFCDFHMAIVAQRNEEKENESDDSEEE